MMTFIAIVVFMFSAFSLTMTGVDYKNATAKERKKQRAVFIFIAFESSMSLLLSIMVIINAL